MSNALLTTKFYFPPPRPSPVPRSRLIKRLKAGLQGPLTFIATNFLV
jgi:ATP/maltotriose-dependent transcriptional regulator MalT